MMALVIGIKDNGAYAGILRDTARLSLSFFPTPSHFSASEEARLFNQNPRLPLFLYLDLKQQAFELEDLSCLSHKEARMYVKTQREAGLSPGLIKASIFRVDRVLWVPLDTVKIDPWLSELRAFHERLQRLCITALEIGCFLERTDNPPPACLLHYEHPPDTRQVVFLGKDFFLTRCFSSPGEEQLEEKSRRLEETKRYVAHRCNILASEIQVTPLEHSWESLLEKMTRQGPLANFVTDYLPKRRRSLLQARLLANASCILLSCSFLSFLYQEAILKTWCQTTASCTRSMEARIHRLRAEARRSAYLDEGFENLAYGKILPFFKAYAPKVPPLLPSLMNEIWPPVQRDFFLLSYEWQTDGKGENLHLQVLPRQAALSPHKEVLLSKKLQAHFSSQCQARVIFRNTGPWAGGYAVYLSKEP